MATGIPENPFFPDDLPDDAVDSILMHHMDGIVQHREQMTESVRRYHKLPLPHYRRHMSHNASLWLTSVADYIQDLKTHEPDDSVRLAAGLLLKEDTSRTELFSTITQTTDKFQPVGQTIDDVLDAYPMEDETGLLAADVAIAAFSQTISIDIGALINHVNSTNTGKAIEMSRHIGRLSLDIAKITAGTILALGIHDRLKKSQ